MKVFIDSLVVNELNRVLIKLHARADEAQHTLVDQPEDAEMVLLCGNATGAEQMKRLKSHPAWRRYPNKCAVYCDDDVYLPLLPGVYSSPHKGYSTASGRVRCYSYIVRHVKKGNPFVARLSPDRARDMLFSFQGSTTSMVRKRLYKAEFRRADVLIEDTTHHTNWVPSANSERQQRAYVEITSRSHFVLCPRGGGTGSLRLFEVMQMGAVPVLLADDYVLPEGPDWDSFLVRVPEKEIDRLPSILEPLVPESVRRGALAAAAWQQWFSTEKEFNEIVNRAHAALASSRTSENLFRTLWPLLRGQLAVRRSVRKSARSAVLGLLRALNLKPPFSVRTHDIPEFDPNSEDDL